MLSQKAFCRSSSRKGLSDLMSTKGTFRRITKLLLDLLGAASGSAVIYIFNIWVCLELRALLPRFATLMLKIQSAKVNRISFMLIIVNNKDLQI